MLAGKDVPYIAEGGISSKSVPYTSDPHSNPERPFGADDRKLRATDVDVS